jgi:hypothetical protein
MLSILSSILGFATAGLPNILSFFQQKGDQAHERKMAEMQNQQQMNFGNTTTSHKLSLSQHQNMSQSVSNNNNTKL